MKPLVGMILVLMLACSCSQQQYGDAPPTDSPEYRALVKDTYSSKQAQDEESLFSKISTNGLHFECVAFLERYPSSIHCSAITAALSNFRVHGTAKNREEFISFDEMARKYGWMDGHNIYRWADGPCGWRYDDSQRRVLFGKVVFGGIQILDGTLTLDEQGGTNGVFFSKAARFIYRKAESVVK